MTYDKLFIHDLKIETIIGAYEWERKLPQVITLDLEYAVNSKQAAEHDELSYTCNYSEVGQALTEFVKQSQFYLVETMADKSAELLMTQFKIPWLKLTIRKIGTLQNAKEVGIVIERGKNL